jgi:hypothetical protein
LAVYDGYGDYTGYSTTYHYVTGQSLAGVKAVEIDVAKNAPNTWTNASYWTAYDILGNLRILKAVREGSTVFEASVTNTPLVIMPASLVPGASWNYFGAWYTIVSTNASYQGYTNLLEAQWVSGFDVDQEYYQFGVGQLFDYWYDSPVPSGWRLRMP